MKTYVVRATDDGGWQVRREGRNTPLLEATSRSQAVDLAAEVAASHAPARLVVEDGEGGVIGEWQWDEPSGNGRGRS